MREIVLDTETTGLDPQAGHRIVEIACLELSHHIPTGREFHRYVNPDRDMPADAYSVHGLTAEFLPSHPPFASIVDDLLAFIGTDPLVIHNAEFDLAFLNMELVRARPLADRDPSCRHLGARAAALSRVTGKPRRAVPALCHRFVQSGQPWSKDRLRFARRRLSRTDRRASAWSRFRRACRYRWIRRFGLPVRRDRMPRLPRSSPRIRRCWCW